ncbi:hypothetical protein [uncultured Dokdonia sp.]|uniref:hypothetical protein n=1 Tax=uncultured Dokdonia sp. TaxID=575653 RepID=UPI00260B6FC3|nr:hypothetical protein [uncultured Dokdonia sp.]
MPLGESMITVLRSNKRKNVNDSYFKNRATTIKDRQKESFDHTSASPQLLHKIKTEIEAQHRKRNKTLLLIGGIIFIILATTLWFLKDQNYI